MSQLNKYEVRGIFISIVVMAVILGFLRFQPTDQSIVGESNGEGGDVIVVENPAEGTALEAALVNSSSVDGELLDLVVNDVEIGTGREVQVGDTLVVDYIGATEEGTQFDSSYERGTPFIFTVGDGMVIEGWEKGLLGMQVGGQRILVIPPHMGYGNRQVGPIGPDSVLVFAVELLEIK